MSAYQSHAASNACSVSQYATEAALSGGEEEISQMVAAFDARRKLLHKLVNGVPELSAFLPKGAFYIMVDVRGISGRSIEALPSSPRRRSRSCCSTRSSSRSARERSGARDSSGTRTRRARSASERASAAWRVCRENGLTDLYNAAPCCIMDTARHF